VLPWRDPVSGLLGEVGPPLFELVQTEFTDLFEFERASDARQIQWSQNGTWAAGWDAHREQPTELALRNLVDFDTKVKQLATAMAVRHKVGFSSALCIHADQDPEVVEEERPVQIADDGEQEDKQDLSADELAVEHAVGDMVECYWPDDEVWLHAVIQAVYHDGSLTVTWEEDNSESVVPADYVRPLRDDGISEPPAKRVRR